MPIAAALAETLPEAFRHQLRSGRDLATERRRAPGAEYVSTASEALDHLLEGGLPRGRMVEIIGRPSSGRFSLLLETLAATTNAGEAAALVDLGDSLEPRAAREAGVDLTRLLWVRPRSTKEALASAETILASGIALLTLDLGLPPVPGGRGAEAAWLRLARSAQARRAAFLVASPYRASGTAATTVLRLDRRGARWSGQSRAPRLLTGLGSEVEQIKSRSRSPGAKAQLHFRDPRVPHQAVNQASPPEYVRPEPAKDSAGVLAFPPAPTHKVDRV